MNKYDYNLL